MNRFFFFLPIPLFLSVFCAFSQPIFNDKPVPMTGVMSMNPKTVGQGFAFTANAFGYNSFFYNPAGFAMENINKKTGKKQNGDITALSISSWFLSDTKLFSITNNFTGYIGEIETKLKTIESDITKIAKGFSDGEDVSASLAQVFTTLGEMTGAQSVYDDITEFLVQKADILTQTLTEPPTYEQIRQDPDIVTDWVTQNRPELEQIITDPALQSELIGVTATALVNSKVVQDMFSFFPSHFQAGFNAGFGVVKSGFGFGFTANFDAAVEKDSTVYAVVSPTLMLNAGYAFKLLDDKLRIGFNVRPMLKLAYFRFDFTETNVLNMFTSPQSAANMLPLYSGFGIGLDIGAIYKLKNNVNLAIVLKDAPTFFQMYSTDVISAFKTRSVASVNFFSQRVGNLFYVPPDLVIGASWQFNPLSMCTLTLSGQIGNWIPQLVYLQYYGMPFNAVSLFNAGVSLELLKFLTLSAGFGNSFFTTGIGFNFWLLDINIAAVYNPTVIAQANSFGVSLEIAIRF